MYHLAVRISPRTCVVGVKRSASPARSPAKRECGGRGCSHWADGPPPTPLPPPSLTPITPPSPSQSSATSSTPSSTPLTPPAPQRCCNSCGAPATGPRLYCNRCVAAGRECRACHRPMSDRFFAASINTCNACTRKRVHTTVERFGDALATCRIDTCDAPDLEICLRHNRRTVSSTVTRELAAKRGVKFYLSVELRMSRFDVDGTFHTATPTLRSDISIVLIVDDIEGAMDAAIACLARRLDAYMEEGSGWTLDSVVNITIHMAAYNPLHGATYLPTPKKLDDRKAIVNVYNTDNNECFVWAVLAGLLPVDRNTSRVSKYVEAQNAVSVNVFGYEDAVYPLRLTELCDRPRANLLLLADHVPHCKPHGPQRMKMPSGDDTIIHFHHEDHQLRVPFVIYADFECYTEKLAKCIPDAASFTHLYQQHTPSGYCFHVVSDHPGYKSYRGPDVVDHFLESLRHEHRLINFAIDCPVPMTMTPAVIEDFASATTCHICGKDATRMVRDHDHLTGAYRGAAHNKCNLRLHFRGKWRFPSFYTICVDTTPTLSPQPSVATPVRINVVANNMTKYVLFSLGRLRFIDSLQFMSASLEKLVAERRLHPPRGLHHPHRASRTKGSLPV